MAPPSSSRSNEVVVIGAGLNGLAVAALLARRGRRVLVLERRGVIGGLAAAEEFHPGYRSAGLLHDTHLLRPSLIDALGLEQHGLRLREHRPDLLSLGEGRSLLIPDDISRARDELGQLSSSDAVRYVSFRARLDRFRPVLLSFLEEQPPDVLGTDIGDLWNLFKKALRVRRLGPGDMMELLRLPPMPVADFLGEWFETDLLKAALALPAVMGCFTGPRSPGTTTNLLLREALAGPGVAGGGHTIAAAVEAAAREAGVEIRTDCAVSEISVEKGCVTGVTLEQGEEIPAPVVISTCDPRRTFLSLLPRWAATWRLRHRIANYRMRGSIAHILLALEKPIRFSSRTGEPIEYAVAAGSLDAIEQAYDSLKYRRVAERPALDIFIPTISSPELAPEGHTVVSILAHGVPYVPREEVSASDYAQLCDRVVDLLDEHAPGMRHAIVGRRVWGPSDIEEHLGLTGGHLLHGEPALDQILIRPVPECAGYRTPVDGLYLCGGSTHPGGGLTGAPALLAAKVILGG